MLITSSKKERSIAAKLIKNVRTERTQPTSGDNSIIVSYVRIELACDLISGGRRQPSQLAITQPKCVTVSGAIF